MQNRPALSPQIDPQSCRITPEIQLALKEKRRQLGLTYRALGEFFHLSWSSFRRWERSDLPEIRCRRFFLRTLNDYLGGLYDDALRATQMPSEELVESWRRLPEEVHQCMERITTTYELCQTTPELRTVLLQNLRKATKEALGKFLRHES